MLWIIALVLLALVGLVGYYQGPIRVAASLVGLLVGALLAMPLSPVIAPIVKAVGLKHPLWLSIVPPVVVFLAILIIFKIIGAAIHRKINVSFKYDPDDKRFYRWERLNHRLGLCLGLFNGAVYFYLLLIPLYVAGYLTLQISSGESDPAGVRFINQTREQLHSSKIDRVLAAYDPAPKEYYVASDILGLVKHNPLLESRLAHYPVFLSLAERKEFQDLATDVQLQQMFQTEANIMDIVKHPKVQAILTNADITAEVSQLIRADLSDLHDYLSTGKSAKYGEEKILGIWSVDAQATVNQATKKLTGLTLQQKNQMRNMIYSTVTGLTLTATIDNKAILKKEKADESPTVVSQGTWKRDGDNYEITLPDNQPETVQATLQGEDRIILPRGKVNLVLTREL